jgi:hypothetical protein
LQWKGNKQWSGIRAEGGKRGRGEEGRGERGEGDWRKRDWRKRGRGRAVGGDGKNGKDDPNRQTVPSVLGQKLTTKGDYLPR